ncbi:DinB family protein [uncultured Roseobacter sp.]|uniref:DinB family protein n=1 Tax=uncultured Roseobacter sp. TaxID=114847 RepID=UPI002604E1B9|nr:DinB family protein [uncultured Roseobacter sp.]
MISANYCRFMARYNAWQNTSLLSAADELSDAARQKDRGAFFRSIAATLNHLYWADALILNRLKGNARPEETIRHSLTSPSVWSDYKTLRMERDAEIEAWADLLVDADLAGVAVWYPGDGSTRIEKPKSLCAAELFNHQTHHRGQVHAMLTAAGAEPGPTNLSAMPQVPPNARNR